MVSVTRMSMVNVTNFRCKVISQPKHPVLQVKRYSPDGEFIGNVTGSSFMLMFADAMTSRNALSSDLNGNDYEDNQIEPECYGQEEIMNQAVLRTIEFIHSFGELTKVEFEVPIALENVRGRIDCVARYKKGLVILFEIKCVTNISDEHCRQTCTYLKMYKATKALNEKVRAIVYNPFNNHGIEIFQL